MKQISLIFFNLAISLIGGYLLSQYIANLPYEMPWFLGSIRFVLHAVGHRELDNPDALEALGIIVLVLVSVIFVGAVVWLCSIGVRRYLSARSANSH